MVALRREHAVALAARRAIVSDHVASHRQSSYCPRSYRPRFGMAMINLFSVMSSQPSRAAENRRETSLPPHKYARPNTHAGSGVVDGFPHHWYVFVARPRTCWGSKLARPTNN